eukprot:339622-Pleurochrysis_carterae.AAC.1
MLAPCRFRHLVVVGGDVRREGEVLDESARLSLGRIRRAEHPPLRRLQRARTAHLARLLKLRHDA